MAISIIFDDGRGRLGPLTDLRSAGEVRTGALTTLERLSAVVESLTGAMLAALWVPQHIAPLAHERIDLPVNDDITLADDEDEDDVILANARCVLPPLSLDELKRGHAIAAPNGSIIAARLARDHALAFLRTGTLSKHIKATTDKEPRLLERPWDIIRFRDAAIDIDLAMLMHSGGETQGLPPGVTGINDEDLRISPDATVYPGVILDAESGPIVIDDNAIIRPGAIICGPAYIGEGATVLERAHIKPHTAIGPVCKVSGEIGGTIMQSFSNKSHDGHLGDAWLGEWINLGAGTTNSNLLNTYGEVAACAEPGAPQERTGLTFLGCILGDHVKTAICTRIMTGAVIGTGAMIATTAPANGPIERFAWRTDKSTQRFRWPRFEEAARAMMSRRGVEPSAPYLARLKELHHGDTESTE